MPIEVCHGISGKYSGLALNIRNVI